MTDTAADEEDETYSAIRTILGATHRSARWHLTDEVDIVTALGRSRFDFRLVETTGRPVVEISVKCFLGSVSLVVPPGTLVVLDGTSFLARASSEVAPGPISELPRIEVTATTFLGRVKIASTELDVEAAAVAIDEVSAPAPAEEAVIDAVSAESVDTAAHDTAVDDSPVDDSVEPIAS